MVRRLSCALLVAAACGGSETPVRTERARADERVVRPPPPADDDADDGVEVEGTKGHLEPFQIDEGVRPHQARLSACYQDELRKTRFLDGSVSLDFVVEPDGKVSAVRLAKGDLGSWAVERCMLEVGRAMKFAEPRGGKAAEFSLPLDLHSGKGEVVWWTEEQADGEVAAHRADLDACSDEAEGSPRNVWITLYVGPRGKVRSVGFASPSGAIDDGWCDCVVEKVAAWTLSDPRGRVAKAGFRYRPE
jgi:hypothetical protein